MDPWTQKQRTTIVIGADVTHPGVTSAEGTPSIAAVVGSVDDQFTQFPGSTRLQRSRKEEIVELGDMVKECLIDWAVKHEDKLPTHVLFYRDGVSESQYEALRNYEIPQIKQAFKWAQEYLESKRKPERKPSDHDFKLIYVVVGKRHNTRFYRLNEEDKIRGRKNNPNLKPGFVVDTVITHSHSFDFYLQSHNPIVGTGRAAHYFVLKNNMDLTDKELQQVTHNFCYAYSRATKGVSYCAPAYYADRLCDRGRAYLRHWLKRR
ncbi:hypothetical protein BAUCODRAFT_65525 [Baudoinia panamericana UAMH 10762]|uniref:Piwi domain-containing protein n=1 Tax=Baudoinia panamericana (strain UAMH 10762) TaxID=717646 RepID=M2MRD2_BAUPA|nr:uncharacterized protein BAUCODRAFT_65525 [Baudoinia panamericana UAMH 10762]EMC99396.1 hypothetical protein BAUCODRAFT_65525 [Baudoinia panamericana UAMH 10762]